MHVTECRYTHGSTGCLNVGYQPARSLTQRCRRTHLVAFVQNQGHNSQNVNLSLVCLCSAVCDKLRHSELSVNGKTSSPLQRTEQED